MELLTDFFPLDSNYINEALDNKKDGKIRLKGLFQEADIRNGNGRIYTLPVLSREVSRLQEAINRREILGELEHPTEAKIDLNRVATVITELRMEGNKVFGILEVLDTPSGLILQALVEAKVAIGISSRGLGSVLDKNGVLEVQEDYQMLTFDCVQSPSTPGSYITENKKIKIEEKKYNMLHAFNKGKEILWKI